MLYLASQSPQRATLLTRGGIDYTIVASRGDEECIHGLPPIELANRRAEIKAVGAILPATATGFVLGADTVVALGEEVFGKPLDDDDGFRILSRLQGTTHRVITGHHVIRLADGAVGQAHAVAEVTMRQLSAAEIAEYLATGEHRGRAGAYAIQETGDRFVSEIRGAWDTVVGLHMDAVHHVLAALTTSASPTGLVVQAALPPSAPRRALR